MKRLYDKLPVSLQNAACTIAAIQRKRRRFSAHFERTLAWLEDVAVEPEARARIQWDRFRSLHEHARRHVPAYADLPELADSRDPRDALAASLERIEPLTKERFRKSPADFLEGGRPDRRWLRGHTSGTTGSALDLWYTHEALAEEYAVVWRMRRLAGADRDEPHFTFGGRMIVPFESRKPPFWRRDWGSDQTIFSNYHMTESNLPLYVEAVHRHRARWVQGYPSALHLVARALLDRQMPVPRGRIRAIFTSSESLLAYQRRDIEEGFGAPIWDRYGVSELAASMTSCEKGHLHIDTEFCIVEVEVQERGPSFIRGPLLVTGLANLANPFIRYRVGDSGTQLLGTCPCGRPGQVFSEIDGRIEDYVLTPDGRRIGRLDHIFKELDAVTEAQIIQHSQDEIEIRFVPAPGHRPTDEPRILRQVRERVGTRLKVTLTEVSRIPREANGKLRLVLSKLENAGPAQASAKGDPAR